MLWYDFSIIDHILVEKLHKKPFFFDRFMNGSLPMLKSYDRIVAHSFVGGLFAYEAFKHFSIPYFMNWHGSEVHTYPWRNPLIMRYTKLLMENAAHNFFVSKALLLESEKIVSSARKSVLYNGVSDKFVRFDDADRKELRRKYGLADGDKVVAFAGSLVEVKNVHLLQPIFHEIRRSYDGALKFWVIGDGKRRSVVEPALLGDSLIDVHMFGNLPSDEMPSVMNCVDVLILPSRNEGLGMVCAEAIRCGANAVGTDVGGVAEVVGQDNVVSLGESICKDMAAKVATMLMCRAQQTVPDYIDWNKTADQEIAYLREA
jgi:glycosyltransferase involved in cell wall biosynthesis